MARELGILNATVDRPDERGVRPELRVGPSVALTVESRDPKSRPVHVVRITEDQALRLLAQLAAAIENARR